MRRKIIQIQQKIISIRKKTDSDTCHPMMNLLFGTHDFCKLQAGSQNHLAPPDSLGSLALKDEGLLSACGMLHSPATGLPFQSCRTVIEITECINNQMSEIPLIIPMKQIKIPGTEELKAGQSKAVGVFKEIILPASTWGVTGLAC